MPSPVRWNQHGAPHADSSLARLYQAFTAGVQAGDNATFGWTWTANHNRTPP